MEKKWFLLLNVAFLVIVSLAVIYFVWTYSSGSLNENKKELLECVDVNNVASFVYDLCYDAQSKNILMQVKRGEDKYNVNSIFVSFFDFSNRNYSILEVPHKGESKIYRISAEKNPENLDISLGVVKDFSAPICNSSRRLYVKYCEVDNKNNINVSFFEAGEGSDVIPIGEKQSVGGVSDVFSPNLVDEGGAIDLGCISKWKCSEWGMCENGVQRRDCVDENKCDYPTDFPDTTKYCGQGCVEKWQCSWSDCSDGYTTPSCVDLNHCGTTYNIPSPIKCIAPGDCVSDISCSDWTSCEVDYNLLSLIDEETAEYSGIQRRVCRDKNSCVNPVEETRSCSVSVDIYTKRFTKCGIEYIGIYNKLDDNLIARIEAGSGDNPYVNIHLDDWGDSPYCDYCYDGVLNGDEEMIDCGGSCPPCSEVYPEVPVSPEGNGGEGLAFIASLLKKFS